MREARVYSDRELLELFRMLLRQQIREERIHNFTELYGLLAHVEQALAEPQSSRSGTHEDQTP